MSLLRRKAGLQPVAKKKKAVEELEKVNDLLRKQLLKKTIEAENTVHTILQNVSLNPKTK